MRSFADSFDAWVLADTDKTFDEWYLAQAEQETQAQTVLFTAPAHFDPASVHFGPTPDKASAQELARILRFR